MNAKTNFHTPLRRGRIYTHTYESCICDELLIGIDIRLRLDGSLLITYLVCLKEICGGFRKQKEALAMQMRKCIITIASCILVVFTLCNSYVGRVDVSYRWPQANE